MDLPLDNIAEIAEKIGINKIIFSQFSSVLSAYGISLSKSGFVQQYSVEDELKEKIIDKYKKN